MDRVVIKKNIHEHPLVGCVCRHTTNKTSEGRLQCNILNMVKKQLKCRPLLNCRDALVSEYRRPVGGGH